MEPRLAKVACYHELLINTSGNLGSYSVPKKHQNILLTFIRPECKGFIETRVFKPACYFANIFHRELSLHHGDPSHA